MTDQPNDGGTVAENDAQTGTVTEMRPADRYRQMVSHFAAQNRNSKDRSNEIMSRQIDAILMAGEHGSEDDIWDADAGGTIQCRDADGLEVTIHDLEYVWSNRPDIDADAYASMNGTVLGGPRDLLQRLGVQVGVDCVLQTGAEMFHAKIRAFQARGMLPISGVVTALETGSGNSVIKFLRLPERSVPGTTAQ
jgi:hypothetical protein